MTLGIKKLCDVDLCFSNVENTALLASSQYMNRTKTADLREDELSQPPGT
jgi:hypothetical protein